MNWVVPSAENIVSFLQKGVQVPCSGKAMRKVLEANFCRVNGKIERFGSSLLKKGDRVELATGWDSLLKAKDFSFSELYEDEFCLIVNKPAGWVCEEKECLQTFGPHLHLVHRLDKGTTGVLLLSKGLENRETLLELFAKREMEKSYLALVDGNVRRQEGIRESRLGKKKSYAGQTIWGSVPNGLSAVTRWETVAQGKETSLIECRPETGRTHQIRVHLSEMGHPILGDRQYAKYFRSNFHAARVLLHAKGLRFNAFGKEIAVEAPLPDDFKSAMQQLSLQKSS